MYNRLLIALLVVSPLVSRSQNIDLMMQAWYWDYFTGPNFGNWVSQLNTKTTELKNAGFKHIWLPPLPRTSTPNNYTNGYNPKDLYDLGETFGGGACAWGTRAHLNALIANYNANGMIAVSDVVYNHRDGGRPEKNPAVKTYIESGTGAPFPSDRFFCVLPLGSANPGNNGAGDYYLKIRSKSQGYSSNTYKLYAKTNSTVYNPTVLNESEPNGGGDCGQPFNVLPLGQDMNAQLGAFSGCHIDEFKITLTAGNFNATDDTLYIYMTNTNGYSDHYVYGLWSAPRSQDIRNEVEYWSYTDFYSLPSGQGGMNYNDFRPNTNTALTESLGCDWNCPLFFYDYDQSQTHCASTLEAWTKWQINTVGLKGLRMDAVKHFDPAFVSDLLNYLETQNAMPQFVVGEFYDGNAALLSSWVEQVYDGMSSAAQAQLKPRVFDFTLRESLKKACEESWDARNVFNGSMRDAGVGADPFKIVTFVNNHDFRDAGQPVQKSVSLAYAYIMTNNQVGAPCIFYPDYYGVAIPNAPVSFLKSRIDNLTQVHQQYIYGSSEIDYLSRFSTPYYQSFLSGYADRTLIYQLKPNSSGKDVVVAINFSAAPLDVYQELNDTWGAIPTGTSFTDVLGYGTGGSTVNVVGPAGQPQLHIQLPGFSYTVFVENATPLPAQLVDFQATEEKGHVDLRWQTATERLVSTFEVERSVGNALHFDRLGQVPARNHSAGERYVWTDETAPANTDLYYRLKVIDADGSFVYSPMEKVRLERLTFHAVVAPNPATGPVSVVLDIEKGQDISLTAVNTLGQTLFNRLIFAETGVTELQIPDLPSGRYQLIVRGDNEQQVIPFIKQ